FLSSGDYAGLASYYERWVAEHQDDIDAVLRLARVLSIQGRSEEALKWFEKSIERAPTDTAPRLAIIDAYLADSRYADAAKQFEQLVAADSSNPDYLVRWGQVLMSDTTKTEGERQQAAAAVWKRLAAAKPKDAAIQTQVADLMRGAKLTDEALAGYRTAISLAPNEPQHKEYLGEYLHQLGRKDEALEVWRSLAAGELRTRENLIRLSEVLHQFEQADEALKTLAEACTMRPKVHERLRYAELLREAQQFDKALEQIELARTESETVDERDRVFAAAVQTYQTAGQLPQQIEAARQAAEKIQSDPQKSKSPEASELWRQLAILHEANRQTQESLEAIDKAVAAAPTNIETLDIAARMFEEAGRLPLAIEKRRLLADTDRRFRSGHLQRLAALYIQSGNTDAAITAGREMLSGAGGSIDAFKFYAELCGQAGRDDERIDTLRRCLRLNPRSEDAQQLLATQLADDFKTEQAIELYWKMLDTANDIEKRREVVKKLADLYLRTNRLDQLISRIELRGRESGDRRTAIDLTAAAYQQAGDLGLAREALEGLLRDSGRDTLLLERLVGLAEQAGEIEKAIELQRQLLRLAPSRTAESRLASLLIDIGATEEAQSMWLSMVEKNTDAQQVAASIDRLFAAGESKVAIELSRKVIEDRPEDWETRFKLAVLLAETSDWESAAKVSAEIRAIKLDDATLPVGTKPKSQQAMAGVAGYQQPPIRMMRMQSCYELLQILDDRYGYQARTALPKPIDFGHAKLMAMYIAFRSEVVAGGDPSTKIAELEKKANEKDASAETMWDWYESDSMASLAQQGSGADFQDPSKWGVMWRLADLDSVGEMALIQMFANRQNYAERADLRARIKPLNDEQLAWLKAKVDDPRQANPQSPYGGRISWSILYAAELRIASKVEEADAFSRDQLTKIVADSDAKNLLSNIQYLASYGTDDQLWAVIQKLLSADTAKLFQMQYGGRPAASLLGIFAQQKRVDDKLSNGPSDPEYRTRLMQLCDALIASESQTPAKRKTIRMTGIGGVRSTYRIVGGNYQQLEISFPPQGLGPEDDFVQALYSTKDLLKDHLSAWIEHLKQSETNTSERGQVMIKLTRASLMQWSEKTAEAIAELNGAIELATAKVPALEPELRLMLADLLLRQDRKAEALQAIELLSVYDQNTMAIREFSAAKLAAVLGDKQRAQAAAKRLFGVRLDTESQVELAKLMRSLDMNDLASDLVRRMRSRGGSNSEQLRTLLTYFQTQDDKEQAAEVAMELLQRTSPTRTSARNQARNITTAETQLRKTAMQALAAAGKLSPLIAATEKRLEQSPKSQRVRAELSELYAGAGKADKAAALFADTKPEDLNSTSGLEAAAKQLVALGKTDEACDAYLKILRRKPQLFQNEFYEIKRPFEQTKRAGELADLVLEVGLKKFESYRVSELCSDLLRDNKDTTRARKLYMAILEMSPTSGNGMYNLNSVLGNARELLNDKATLEKTVQYLIEGSKNSSADWNSLFQGYSTGSDGRHNNATTSLVRAIAGNKEFSALTENLVRQRLKEEPGWYEGKAWLGLLLTARKQYDEAKTLLEPLARKEMKPQPTHAALWLIGSLIDEHKPMQEIAADMYDYALRNTESDRQSEFQYTLEYRACKLMSDIGRRERAREMISQAIEKIKKQPKRSFNNADYEAYQYVRTMMSMIDMLASIDYPTDALRIAREFDRSLFAKVEQFQRNLEGDFDKKQKQLLEVVRKLGGLPTAATMIEDSPAGTNAVDFGITYGERPFSERGIQSLWIDLIEEAEGKPEQADALEKLVTQLNTLSDNRKLDDSAHAAWAIAADVAGDGQPLRQLLANWG
ncbi:MAG: tetratricopeptide repeat protein, partial [Pirellulaceae bacterium]|nr:tetratricopeptide repeat protein [Pirellulaceae bacterium]